MKLHLAYYGNPILRKKGTPVAQITDEIRQLVEDMIETMREHNGIGLAAHQVRQPLLLFVTEVPEQMEDSESGEERWIPGKVRVFINPKILSYSEQVWEREEGCLSIPGLYAPVVRPQSIKVRAMDLNGELFEEEFRGLQARCIMHENDHINGVLFIDRIHGTKRKALEHKLHEVKREYSK